MTNDVWQIVGADTNEDVISAGTKKIWLVTGDEIVTVINLPGLTVQ